MERTVLVQVMLSSGATLEDAIEALGLRSEDVDQQYGLVPIGKEGDHVLLVSAEAVGRMGVLGQVFSNPRIEPFDM